MNHELPTAIFDETQFRQSLTGAVTLPLFKSAIKAVTEKLHARFRENEKIENLIHWRATFFDQLLRCAWEQHGLDTVDNISLCAVGGYGRGELHPCSDIDLLILFDHDALNAQKEKVETFITFLWDLNLKIGHAVRSLSECQELARNDITIATNLMENRTIAGSDTLRQTLKPMIGPSAIWTSRDFFKAKWEEQLSRHRKYNNTEYNLEPNVKSCPGGLRDIQTIGWVAKRHFDTDTIEALLTQGFLSEAEFEIITKGRAFLWKIRYALHMITHRDEDRLLFDHQITVANMMGFKDNEDKLAVEQFMQRYYRWALSLTELNDVVMQHFDEAILRACESETLFEINARFRLRNNYIEVVNDRVFKNHPPALLEIFVLIAENPNIIGVRASTIRLIREYRQLIDDDFRNDPRNQQLFLDLLGAPQRVASELKRMRRYGVLGMYIPEFGRIIGQTQHDMFHIYTVDAHTLLLIKNIRRFTYEDHQDIFPVAWHIVRRLEKIELLYIAGLFHDIAKGRGGDHSELGASDAYNFCRLHGYNKRDCNLVAWLVRKHLLMSSVSQRKDISDPEVIHEFAIEVGDQVHLDYLFALTVADVNATNPNLWTSWRASLMRQLYLETKRALRRGLEHHIDRQDWIEGTQNSALAKLERKGLSKEQVLALWDEPGDDYFLRENATDIAWQTEAIANHKDRNVPLVVVKDSTVDQRGGGTQIFIHTKSKAYLFAVISSALEQMDLSIQDARIYETNSGYTMDTFFVLDSNDKNIGHDPARFKYIQDELTEEISSTEDFSEMVQRRTPRALKHFSVPTRTNLSIDYKKGCSVLEVITPDRPGLLARIGRIFVEHGITLRNAKITTLGERVEDVFFISDKNDKPISDPDLARQIQAEIRQTLDENTEQGKDQPGTGEIRI